MRAMTQPQQHDDRVSGYAVASWAAAIILGLVGFMLIMNAIQDSGGIANAGADIAQLVIGATLLAVGLTGMFVTLAAGAVTTALHNTTRPAAASTPAPWPTVGQYSPWQGANLTQPPGPPVPQQPSQPQ